MSTEDTSKKQALTLDDVFNSDDLGLLDAKATKKTAIKTDDDRVIESFEEINVFFDKHGREPSKTSMSERQLCATLKHFREDETKKKLVKPYDKHDLLGHVQVDMSIADVFDNDALGLLNTDKDLSIFQYNHVPKESSRAKTDYVAKRKPMSEDEFLPYEKLFHQVHHDIKSGKRHIVEFKDVDSALDAGNFYFIDGVMLFLENIDLDSREDDKLSKNTKRRKDGRTRTVFENGTLSNMYYRSVGKAIYNGGRKMVSQLDDNQQELFVGLDALKAEDEATGWIYVLKTKANYPELSTYHDLHKIGFSSVPVDERIKNAQQEATYLFADVKPLITYKIHNRNADKLEKLLHRVFAKACLDVEFTNQKGQRINPREWFNVPFEVIDEAIQLIINEKIVDYEYCTDLKALKLKNLINKVQG